MALSFDDLERVYEALAEGIDQAGPQQETLFLAKLGLLLSNEVGEFAVVRRCVAAALADLPGAEDGHDT